MILMGLFWLYLVVIDMVRGLDRFGQNMASLIWIVFIIDFLIRFMLAPRKLTYIRHNWFTVIALFLPALRIFRVVRAFRALAGLRGLQLVGILLRSIAA